RQVWLLVLELLARKRALFAFSTTCHFPTYGLSLSFLLFNFLLLQLFIYPIILLLTKSVGYQRTRTVEATKSNNHGLQRWSAWLPECQLEILSKSVGNLPTWHEGSQAGPTIRRYCFFNSSARIL
ncbi:hypothetical protein CFOL_v3_14074, partial [Cephalotus follicularis]